MFYWRMLTFINVRENDSARAGIVSGYNKPQAIGATLGRKPRASVGIAQIAEIAQLTIRRRALLPVRAT